MIRWAIILLIAGLAIVSAKSAEVDVPRYLDSTRLIENVDGRDGAHQERGPYGIRPATWRQHMGTLSFALAREERWGRECARRHVAWLQGQLQAAGIDPNVYNLALAYNAGLETVLRGRAPVRAYDHATRLRNLYLPVAPRLPATAHRPRFVIP